MSGNIFCMATALCLCSSIAQSAPVQWTVLSGGNGHYYEFVAAEGIEWIDANAAATARSYNGVFGYLATLTSAAEDTFVDTNFASLYIEAWAGGFQTPSNNPDPVAGWGWVTGEPWIYTNWKSGEPNDFGGPEMYLSVGGDLNSPQFIRLWNDDGIGTDPQLKTGYLVEYSVPEPASGFIVILAAPCVIRRRHPTTDRM